MDWQQVRSFYYVATLGSFTKAAEVVFRSQSALSHQIKALEEHCGCKLFERMGKKNLVLTDAGKTMLQFAESIFAQHENMLREMSNLRKGQAGYVRVAVTPATSLMFMPGVVQRFQERHPEISLTLYERIPATVVEMVNKGLANFGVGLESLVPSYLESRRWSTTHFLLMVPQNHPLTAKEDIELADLTALPLIVPPETQRYATRQKLNQKARDIGLELNILLESSNIPVCAEYVRRGLGVCFFSAPECYKDMTFDGLACIPVDHLFEPGAIALFYRKETLDLPSAKVFYDSMLAHELPAL